MEILSPPLCPIVRCDQFVLNGLQDFLVQRHELLLRWTSFGRTKLVRDSNAFPERCSLLLIKVIAGLPLDQIFPENGIKTTFH